MATTYAEFVQTNPDKRIIGGSKLGHNMEYVEATGWEVCLECNGQENEMDDICPASNYADEDYVDWEDYEEVSPGVRRLDQERHEEGEEGEVPMATKRWSVHLGNELAVLDEDHKLVAKARTAEEARLIASAPELKAALKQWISMAINSGLEGCDEILEQAEAAIAKATGQEGE